MPANDSTAAPLRLPRVQAVEVLPGRAARLTLEGGEVFHLSPALTPRASFLPLTAQGVAVLLEDWKDPSARTFAVPAPHDAALSRVFDSVQKPLTLRHPLPTLAHVEALPEGGARLTLEGGEVLDVPAEQNAALTPEYTPAVLAFCGAPLEGRTVIVPDLLLPAVWAALGFAREEGGEE
ncbi:hypothetical protein [Deinococcus sp. YIM 77859]|uniref:hypothetical protein n=1 Tax=Deinococcus sp. YIM 77859 TaxID=1540221 RepID=UPI000558E869|nr:hypothetical protein [Deinococcus sp. YIM 77859]